MSVSGLGISILFYWFLMFIISLLANVVFFSALKKKQMASLSHLRQVGVLRQHVVSMTSELDSLLQQADISPSNASMGPPVFVPANEDMRTELTSSSTEENSSPLSKDVVQEFRLQLESLSDRVRTIEEAGPPIKLNLLHQECTSIIDAFSTPGLTHLNLPQGVVIEQDIRTLLHSEVYAVNLKVLICGVELSQGTQVGLVNFLVEAAPSLQAIHFEHAVHEETMNHIGRWLQHNPLLQVLSIFNATHLPVEFDTAMRTNTRLRRLYMNGLNAAEHSLTACLQNLHITHLSVIGKAFPAPTHPYVTTALQRLHFFAEPATSVASPPDCRCRRVTVENRTSVATYNPQGYALQSFEVSLLPSPLATLMTPSTTTYYPHQLKQEVIEYMWVYM